MTSMTDNRIKDGEIKESTFLKPTKAELEFIKNHYAIQEEKIKNKKMAIAILITILVISITTILVAYFI